MNNQGLVRQTGTARLPAARGRRRATRGRRRARRRPAAGPGASGLRNPQYFEGGQQVRHRIRLCTVGALHPRFKSRRQVSRTGANIPAPAIAAQLAASSPSCSASTAPTSMAQSSPPTAAARRSDVRRAQRERTTAGTVATVVRVPFDPSATNGRRRCQERRHRKRPQNQALTE